MISVSRECVTAHASRRRLRSANPASIEEESQLFWPLFASVSDRVRLNHRSLAAFSRRRQGNPDRTVWSCVFGVLQYKVFMESAGRRKQLKTNLKH